MVGGLEMNFQNTRYSEYLLEADIRKHIRVKPNRPIPLVILNLLLIPNSSYGQGIGKYEYIRKVRISKR
jgi:hypothetical protein